MILAIAVTFAMRAGVTGANQVSTNWSGYVAVAPAAAAEPSAGSPLTFTDATGTWRQPKARCARGRTDSAAFWVGIGGFTDGSPALEQIGTTAQCSSRGVARCISWLRAATQLAARR